MKKGVYMQKGILTLDYNKEQWQGMILLSLILSALSGLLAWMWGTFLSVLFFVIVILFCAEKINFFYSRIAKGIPYIKITAKEIQIDGEPTFKKADVIRVQKLGFRMIGFQLKPMKNKIFSRRSRIDQIFFHRQCPCFVAVQMLNEKSKKAFGDFLKKEYKFK